MTPFVVEVYNLPYIQTEGSPLCTTQKVEVRLFNYAVSTANVMKCLVFGCDHDIPWTPWLKLAVVSESHNQVSGAVSSTCQIISITGLADRLEAIPSDQGRIIHSSLSINQSFLLIGLSSCRITKISLWCSSKTLQKQSGSGFEIRLLNWWKLLWLLSISPSR